MSRRPIPPNPNPATSELVREWIVGVFLRWRDMYRSLGFVLGGCTASLVLVFTFFKWPSVVPLAAAAITVAWVVGSLPVAMFVAWKSERSRREAAEYSARLNVPRIIGKAYRFSRYSAPSPTSDALCTLEIELVNQAVASALTLQSVAASLNDGKAVKIEVAPMQNGSKSHFGEPPFHTIRDLRDSPLKTGEQRYILLWLFLQDHVNPEEVEPKSFRLVFSDVFDQLHHIGAG